MPDRLAVLFAIPNLHGGGAERVLTTILREIDRDRFKTTLAVGSLLEAAHEVPTDIQLVDLGSPRVRHALLPLVSLIRRTRPNVVVSTLDHLNIPLAATKSFWPHGIRLVVRPTLMSSTYGRFSKWVIGRLLRGADAIVLQSRQMQETFCRDLGWSQRATFVIGNPVDLRMIKNAVSDDSVRPLYPRDRFNLVSVGRLDRQKGFDLLLSAIALSATADLSLTILGEGQERASLELQRDRLGLGDVVRFAGFQRNPYPYLERADGLAIASRYEGFPNVVIESLACGTPVVATPIPGVQDLIDGIPECESSYASTAESLAQAITRFAKRGRQRVNPDLIRAFDATVSVRQYENLFNRLASQ